jgi:hypothetical protein
MEEQNFTNFFLVYLLLILSAFFLILDGYEFMRLLNLWDFTKVLINYPDCLRYRLIAKIVFSLFSIFASLSSLIIIIFMIVGFEYFAEKIFSTYIYFNSLIFGPYMLSMSIYGLYYVDDFIYNCDGFSDKSHDMMISLMSSFIFSLIITVCVLLYDTINCYVESILRRRDGNKVITYLFWRTVSVFRNNH